MTTVLRGIDTSNNNPHPIDWATVKNAGASFAFVKATEGVGYKDARFDADWMALKSAQLVRGCYAFARPEWNGPLQEASWFIHTVPHLEPYDIVVLDLETGGSADSAAWALAWLQDVEQALGVLPLVYSNLYFADTWLTDPRLARYPLWCAAYGPDCPPRAGAWDTVALWQHSDASTWPGIQGDVDESLISRDLAGLRALGKQPVPVPPAPPAAQRWLVTVDMRLRPLPQDGTSFYPPQYCYRGAVLNGTGKTNGPWTQVHAGTRDGWLLTANLKGL